MTLVWLYIKHSPVVKILAKTRHQQLFLVFEACPNVFDTFGKGPE